MKRLAAILLTLLYTVSTFGVIGCNLYCHGKLQETNLFSTLAVDNCCTDEEDSSCLTVNDDGCCDSKTFYVKAADQYSLSSRANSTVDDLVKLTHTAVTALFIFQHEVVATASSPAFASTPPPQKQPVYLEHCTFRI